MFLLNDLPSLEELLENPSKGLSSNMPTSQQKQCERYKGHSKQRTNCSKLKNTIRRRIENGNTSSKTLRTLTHPWMHSSTSSMGSLIQPLRSVRRRKRGGHHDTPSVGMYDPPSGTFASGTRSFRFSYPTTSRRRSYPRRPTVSSRSSSSSPPAAAPPPPQVSVTSRRVPVKPRRAPVKSRPQRKHNRWCSTCGRRVRPGSYCSFSKEKRRIESKVRDDDDRKSIESKVSKEKRRIESKVQDDDNYRKRTESKVAEASTDVSKVKKSSESKVPERKKKKIKSTPGPGSYEPQALSVQHHSYTFSKVTKHHDEKIKKKTYDIGFLSPERLLEKNKKCFVRYNKTNKRNIQEEDTKEFLTTQIHPEFKTKGFSKWRGWKKKTKNKQRVQEQKMYGSEIYPQEKIKGVPFSRLWSSERSSDYYKNEEKIDCREYVDTDKIKRGRWKRAPMYSFGKEERWNELSDEEDTLFVDKDQENKNDARIRGTTFGKEERWKFLEEDKLEGDLLILNAADGEKKKTRGGGTFGKDERWKETNDDCDDEMMLVLEKKLSKMGDNGGLGGRFGKGERWNDYDDDDDGWV